MREDLDELLLAYVDHLEELRKADYFIPGSIDRYYRLRSDFEDKYDNYQYDVCASGHWDAPV